jgi:glycosyltransferase involved in cell wall biosynthesis
MTKQNVLVFEAYPFFSGSQRITLNLCKILKNRGFVVTLLLADDQFGKQKIHFEDYVNDIKYIKTNDVLLKYGDEDSWFSKKTFFKSFFLGLIPFYFKSFKLINSKKYDFLYCCDPRGAVLMFIAALFFKKKSILHYHGKNRLPLVLSKILMKVFDEVLCVSQDVANSLPVSKNKIVIYNGLDIDQYTNLKYPEIKDEISLKKSNIKDKTFLYVGAIRPHKGLHHIINSFNEVIKDLTKINKSALLFISGEEKSHEEVLFKRTLVDFIEKEGLSQNIIWLGWNNNVIGWMKNCDYLLFASVNREKNNYSGFGEYIASSEGLPTVLVESSMCKLYSISSSVTGVKEVISKNNGYIYDFRKDGLTKAILEVLKNDFKFKDFPNSDYFKIDTFEKRMLKMFINKHKK